MTDRVANRLATHTMTPRYEGKLRRRHSARAAGRIVETMKRPVHRAIWITIPIDLLARSLYEDNSGLVDQFRMY